MSIKKTNAVSFTRPADTTAYASGDQVANSVTAASVLAMEFVGIARSANAPVRIKAIVLKKSGTGVANAQFRAHFYEKKPSDVSGIVGGDNAAWSTKDRGYVGSIDVTVDKAFTDGSAGRATGDIIARADVSSRSLYVLLEARAAYTPASAEVFTALLEIERDA